MIKLKVFAGSLLGFSLLFLSGCASAPTAWEQKFFDIQTNSVPRLVVVTNVVPSTVTNTGVVLGGLIGAYRLLRSFRASKTAGVLAQVIETGRQVLQATPQGQAQDEQWKVWMVQHQAEQGVIEDVVRRSQITSKAVE
jgi:hypothetical protein